MTNPIPLVLLFQDWPQADKTAWEALFAEGDIFDGTGPCASWSKGSRTKRRQSYGYWLSWVTRHRPALLDQSPTDLITKDAVRGFLEKAKARVNAMTLKNMICDLYVLSKAMHPAGDWDWLNKLSNRLIHLADRKSLPKPVALSAADILNKSLQWLEDVENDPSLTDIKRAIHFRTGLMIAFLISRPVRRRTLLALTTDQHLRKNTEGFEVHLSAEDTKYKKARWFPLPKFLVQPMKSYLDVHRPILLGPKTSNALWISQYGARSSPMVCRVNCRKWRNACWALSCAHTSLGTLRQPPSLRRTRNMSASFGISSGTRRWTCLRSTTIVPPDCQPVTTTNLSCRQR